MSDLIDRQAALDELFTRYRAAERWAAEAMIKDDYETIARAESAMACFNECCLMIKALPSAQPERKTGKWEEIPDPYHFFYTIPVCSKCGCTTKTPEKTLYCPNCGARMGEEDETD